MPDPAQFELVFQALKSILTAYEPHLTVQCDEPASYSLAGQYCQKYKKELWFGGVQIKKNYVSFHLMPVYMYPELLDSASPALRKRMQGKSCFNFTKVEETLFHELAGLTRIGYDRFALET